MAKELVKAVGDMDIVSDHLKVTPYAVEVRGKPSAEEWMSFFNKVSRVNSMSQFYLGDLVVCAEFEWGDKYTDLIQLTDYDYKTLAGYASVARRFTPKVREEIFLRAEKIPSWTSFKLVQSLDDDKAKYFLTMVAEGNWSTRKLEQEIARYKNGGALPDGEEEQPVGVTSFKNLGKKLMKDFFPANVNKEYDEITWLLEMRDWINSKLDEIGYIEVE